MASTSETGHAKNVANFDDLISYASGYGAIHVVIISKVFTSLLSLGSSNACVIYIIALLVFVGLCKDVLTYPSNYASYHPENSGSVPDFAVWLPSVHGVTPNHLAPAIAGLMLGTRLRA